MEQVALLPVLTLSSQVVLGSTLGVLGLTLATPLTGFLDWTSVEMLLLIFAGVLFALFQSVRAYEQRGKRMSRGERKK